VAPFVDPLKRGTRCGLELAYELFVARPTLDLVQEDEKKRCRVCGAVVRRVRALPEVHELAEADLVKDLAGLCIAKVVHGGLLMTCEHPQRRLCQLRHERQ